MTFTKAPIAYEDIRPVLDRAVESEKGIRLTFEKNHEAVRWVSRANYIRTYTREQQKKIYPDPEDPNHHQCEWDRLIIRRPIKDETTGRSIVDVIKGMPLPAEIEELK